MRSGWWNYIVTDGLDTLFAGRTDILTVQEVAELLRMNKAGVYKWLKEGVIPGYHRGRSWFIVRDELKEWMRLGSNQGHAVIASPAVDEQGNSAGAGDAENE